MRLDRKHRTDFRAVKDIEKESLDNIILMMTEGDLVTFQPMGQGKDPLSSFPGTKETGVFPDSHRYGQGVRSEYVRYGRGGFSLERIVLKVSPCLTENPDQRGADQFIPDRNPFGRSTRRSSIVRLSLPPRFHEDTVAVSINPYRWIALPMRLRISFSQ